jgi:hypothetical protein
VKALFDQLLEIADELTEPSIRTVSIPGGWTKSRNKAKPTIHRVTVPGLLAQLYEEAVDPRTAAERLGGGHQKQKSRPPVQIEALSAYDAICAAAIRWMRSVRLETRETVESNIRALVGMSTRLDLDTIEALHGEARQWHRRASVLTGTISPPFQPRVTCPVCETRWSIWVNAEKVLAYCKQCGSDWVGEEIGGLADLVKVA